MKRVTLAADEAPQALRQLALLHRELAVGAEVEVRAAGWREDRLALALAGGGFSTRDRRVARRERTLPDYLDAGLAAMLIGLNPSLYAADAGVGFARPGNRFWPAALDAGLVSADRDPLHALVNHRVGFTDLVKRATARADELDEREYKEGFLRISALVEWLAPAVVCFVGLTGYRVAVARRATTGWQPRPLAGSPVYVMPNPSGLNAHATRASLAAHFRELLAARGASA